MDFKRNNLVKIIMRKKILNFYFKIDELKFN